MINNDDDDDDDDHDIGSKSVAVVAKLDPSSGNIL